MRGLTEDERFILVRLAGDAPNEGRDIDDELDALATARVALSTSGRVCWFDAVSPSGREVWRCDITERGRLALRLDAAARMA